MRADKQLTLVLVESEQLLIISTVVSLFVAGQVLLDVFVDCKTALIDELVEA